MWRIWKSKWKISDKKGHEADDGDDDDDDGDDDDDDDKKGHEATRATMA